MTAPCVHTPQIWPSFLTVDLLIALSFNSWRRRIVPGALPLIFACLFAVSWAAGSVMEYLAVDLGTKISWVKFQAAWQIPTFSNVIRQKIGSSISFDSNRTARPASKPAQKRDYPSVSQSKRKDV